jgi:hypothetical protein
MIMETTSSGNQTRDERSPKAKKDEKSPTIFY